MAIQATFSVSTQEFCYDFSRNPVFDSPLPYALPEYTIAFDSSVFILFYFFFFVFLPFLGLLLRHMEVPGLGVESEL